MIYLCGLLLAFIVIREFQYISTTQKLIDRLMSRNYYDYQVSTTIGKTQETDKNDQLKIPEHDPDLDVLNRTAVF